MRSISNHVQSWLDEHPTIREHVSEGIINHSALARRIRSDIEADLGEKVSIESITIALNRAGKQLQGITALDPLQFIGDISIQTGLTILIFHINDYDMLDLPSMLTQKHGYFVSTRGIWHASIITTSEVAKESNLLSACFEHQDAITSITINLKPGHIPIPGVCAGILSLLANRGVNLQEVISTHNELTILTDQTNADRAIKTLMDVKNTPI